MFWKLCFRVKLSYLLIKVRWESRFVKQRETSFQNYNKMYNMWTNSYCKINRDMKAFVDCLFEFSCRSVLLLTYCTVENVKKYSISRE